MWAIKIFDDMGEGELMEFLDLAGERAAGVEVALYGAKGFSGDARARLRQMSAKNPGSTAMHLSHQKLALSDLMAQAWTWEAFEEALGAGLDFASKAPSRLSPEAKTLATEAAWARELGIQKAVIHLDRGLSREGELWWKSRDPAKIARELAPALRAAQGLGILLHMEKTFESRPWLMAFYEAAQAQGLGGALGFVFDMGHSRVWEREPLGGWIDWMLGLRDAGVSLHFHLHGNPGDRDRHASLPEAHARGWLDPDPQWAPKGAMVELERIEREFGADSMLLLENHTRDAREALGWAQLALG